MATRLTNPPPPPRRVLNLDQAYERAWRAHRAFLQGYAGGSPEPVYVEIRKHLDRVSEQLTRDLIEAGVGAGFAYQLARPPVG